MALPTQVITSTLFDQSKEFADNVMNSNAILSQIEKKSVPGGYEYREPVFFQDSGNEAWIDGLDPIATTITDDLTYAVAQQKTLATSIGISGKEYRQNKSSKHQLIDLMESKIKAAQTRLKNDMVASIYSDGTGSAGKELDGLQKLIAKAPGSATVQGIDDSANAFWKNSFVDIGAASSTSNIQAKLTAAIVAVTRGSERPDFGVADNTLWINLHDSMTANQRIVDEKKFGKQGFQNLVYMGVPIVLDGGVGNQAASATNSISDICYLINSKYLKLKYHPDAYFKPLGQREPVNQDAMFEILLFEGNLCVSNRELQSVVFGS